LIYLILITISVLLSNYILIRAIPFYLVYNILCLVTQFVFTISGVMESFKRVENFNETIFVQIGLYKLSYPIFALFLQTIIAYFLTISSFQSNETQVNNTEDERLVSEVENHEKLDVDKNLDKVETEYENIEDENIEDENFENDEVEIDFIVRTTRVKIKENIYHLFKKLKVYYVKLLEYSKEKNNIFFNIANNLLYFIVINSYYLSLVIVYIACLYPDLANIIHGIYIIFFIMFFVFPSLVKRFWIFLVMYSSLVLISLYLFNLISSQTNNGAIFEVIGLVHIPRDRYYIDLIWHVLIFIFTSIQLQLINSDGLILFKI
jgi:hypothetical protein